MAVAGIGQLNLEPLLDSRYADCYERLDLIFQGKGRDCEVCMAKDKESGKLVALKKIRMDENIGFPGTAIREIQMLKKLQHHNVIKLIEIVTSRGHEMNETYMVLEYMDHDLKGLICHVRRFTNSQIKCYMHQLLSGLYYCHAKQVLHRDITSSNILINNKGNLKLADFELAREFSNYLNKDLTRRVINLEYRAPELLLGATMYGTSVDMWSVGCVFAELLRGEPIFTGTTEAEQMHQIYNLCGSPDGNSWPGVSRLRRYNMLKPQRRMTRKVAEHFSHFGARAFDLLDKMLILNPLERISAVHALNHPFFRAEKPCNPRSLPEYESSHYFQIENKQQQLQQNERMDVPPVQIIGEAQARSQHGTKHNQPLEITRQPVLGTGGSTGGPNRCPLCGNLYPTVGGFYRNSAWCPSRDSSTSSSYPPQRWGVASFLGKEEKKKADFWKCGCGFSSYFEYTNILR